MAGLDTTEKHYLNLFQTYLLSLAEKERDLLLWYEELRWQVKRGIAKCSDIDAYHARAERLFQKNWQAIDVLKKSGANVSAAQAAHVPPMFVGVEVVVAETAEGWLPTLVPTKNKACYCLADGYCDSTSIPPPPPLPPPPYIPARPGEPLGAAPLAVCFTGPWQFAGCVGLAVVGGALAYLAFYIVRELIKWVGQNDAMMNQIIIDRGEARQAEYLKKLNDCIREYEKKIPQGLPAAQQLEAYKKAREDCERVVKQPREAPFAKGILAALLPLAIVGGVVAATYFVTRRPRTLPSRRTDDDIDAFPA